MCEEAFSEVIIPCENGMVLHVAHASGREQFSAEMNTYINTDILNDGSLDKLRSVVKWAINHE